MMTEPHQHREPDYEKAELDLLRDALKRTHEERFRTLMALMKISRILKKATIINKPLAITETKLH